MKSKEKKLIDDLSAIKKKALRYWKNPEFFESILKNRSDYFPLEISLKKVTGSALLNNFSNISQGINEIEENSVKYCYTVNYLEVNNRKIGKQKIPGSIVFNDIRRYLKFVSKGKEYKSLTNILSLTEEQFPELIDFIYKHPFDVLNKKDEWQRILNIVHYFKKNPFPKIYIRQITIENINTKFIENNKSILSKLLCFLFPEKYGETPFLKSQSINSFEDQFGLLYDQPQIRFRILDKEYYLENCSDITLTVSEFDKLNSPIEKIFITENKINALAFPDCSKAMVIFGKGYGINSLKNADWLKEKTIYYWGDIDTHGFHILSNLRTFLPKTRSFLMDEKTLLENESNWGDESTVKRYVGELKNLTDEEGRLFENLKNNYYGENLRLEQELIPYDKLIEFLMNI